MRPYSLKLLLSFGTDIVTIDVRARYVGFSTLVMAHSKLAISGLDRSDQRLTPIQPEHYRTDTLLTTKTLDGAYI